MNPRKRKREEAPEEKGPSEHTTHRSIIDDPHSAGDDFVTSAVAVAGDEQSGFLGKKRASLNGTKKDETEGTSSGIFSIKIWNDVSVSIFGRWMERVRTCLVHIIRTMPSSPSVAEKMNSVAMIKDLGEQMRLTWEAGKHLSSLPSSSMVKYNTIVVEGIKQLVSHLEQLTITQNDPIALCRHYLRVVEEYGFQEDVDGDELGACLGALKYALYQNGYAYSERTSHSASTGGDNNNPTARNEVERDESHHGSLEDEARSTTAMVSIPSENDDDGKCTSPIFSLSSVSTFPQSSSSSPIVSPAERVGYVVSLNTSPYLSPFINTSIQLIEPRKRRPPLDEYRIFSHPKKATTHGVEDVLVDEELRYRSLVILTHHLDTYGSLLGLSPFVRFYLYDILGRVDSKFSLLHGKSASTVTLQRQLQLLRNELYSKKRTEESIRWSLRETAQRIGWYAVSAHWRDQVLSTLQDVEEADWYGLSDTVRGGFFSSRFPNYACSTKVKTLMILVLEKLQSMPITSVIVELPPPTVSPALVIEAVKLLFLPLLEGEVPAWSFNGWKQSTCTTTGSSPSSHRESFNLPAPTSLSSFAHSEKYETEGDNLHTSSDGINSQNLQRERQALSPILTNVWWSKVSRSLHRAMAKWVEHPPFSGLEPQWSTPNGSPASQLADEKVGNEREAMYIPYRSPFYLKEEEDPEAIGNLIIPSMVFPLQCVAELLEVCSSAFYSVHGIASFAEKFLAVDRLDSEEHILEFLAAEEPANVALTALVAIPKIFKDLMCSLPVLYSDMKSLLLTVEAKKIVSEMAPSLSSFSLSNRNYTYWKLLSSALEKEDCCDDLLFLFVKKKSCFERTPRETPCETSPLRCYSEGILERVTKVWRQEIAGIVFEEEKWKRKHPGWRKFGEKSEISGSTVSEGSDTPSDINIPQEV